MSGLFHNRRPRRGSQAKLSDPAASGANRRGADWRSYDAVGERYERHMAKQLAPAGRDLVALAAPPAGGRVLDVGTGTGTVLEMSQEAAGAGGVAVGVDVALGMMRAGMASRPSLRFVGADAVDLPFPDATFDTVVANFVIFHFPKYDTALFDMLRVLKPGGRLAVTTWAPGDDEFTRTWVALVEEVVGHDLLQDAVHQGVPWREHFTDRKLLEQSLREAGLHPVDVEKREYRLQLSREDYVESRAGLLAGRFTHDMLGDEGFERFMERVRQTFAERFPEWLNDFRDVWLAVGTKPAGGIPQADAQSRR